VSPTSLTVTNGGDYSALPIPTRDGWNFDGWYTEAAGGTKVNPADTVSLTAAITLYAQWEEIIVVANNPQIVVGSAEGHARKQVSVAIEITNNPGIVATKLRLSYDQSQIKLIGITDGGLLGANTFTPGNNLNAVPYSFLWDDSLAAANHTANGTLVTLLFEVDENAQPGFVPIEITYDQGSTFDVNMNDVEFVTVNGGITITNRLPGDANEDDSVDLKDVTVLRRFLADWDNVTVNEANADVNDDRVVNLMDVVLLRRYLAGGWGVELK